MANYLAIPVKKAGEVDFRKPFKTFIELTFSSQQYEAVKSSIEDFQNLRSKVVAKLSDRHESTLDVLLKYHDQLCAIESKLPISENSIRIDFKYHDAFEKESLFSSKNALKISSGAFEKMCVLFNIAALQTQVASQQNSDDNGLQSCAKLYRQAAGALGYIKDNATVLCGRELSSDMSSDALSAMISLCLAQAQETVYRKASKDRMKPAMVAKIAMYAADLYSDTLRSMQISSVKSLWPKDWLTVVAGKQAGFHALAEYHQAETCGEARQFGEQIARLQHSDQLFKEAEKRSGSSAQMPFKVEWSKAKKALETVEKDNNTIYHEQVPSINSLSAIEKAAIAKATPLSYPMSEGFRDSFDRLVPIHVHQSVVAFEGRRNEACQMEMSRLREATSLMQGVLTSLNLPMTLEDFGEATVPPSLLDKARDLVAKGGFDQLRQLSADNPELHKRNREILDEAIRLIDEEEEADKKLREQFKEKWQRTPSERLNDKLRSEAMNFKQMLENAANADRTVQQKIADNEEGLIVLSGGESKIRAALPSGAGGGGTSGSGSESLKDELRRLCQDAETMKTERAALETKLQEAMKNIPDGLAAELSTAMSDGNGAQVDIAALVNDKVNDLLKSLRKQVEDQMRRQETLLAQVQSKNTEWSGGAQGTAGSRQAWLTKLGKAYDAFAEVLGNLNEGRKFYSDLTEVLLKHQSRVSDFCFARKTEKEELMRDLQSAIARQPSAQPAPSAPAFHATTAGTGQQEQQQPPPRPPPPNPPVYNNAPQHQQYQQQQQQQPQQPPAYPMYPPYSGVGAYPPPAYPAYQGGYQQPPLPPMAYQAYPSYPSYPGAVHNPYPTYPGPAGGYPGYPGYPQQPPR